MNRDVYILGGLRSYIGVYNGMYRHIPADVLGASVLQQLIQTYHIPETSIDSIICGNAVGGGGNVTRLMALRAGIDETIPAYTIDMQCCSGLESIVTASAKIACGQEQVSIAGGFESVSTQPVRSHHPNHPAYTGMQDTYMTAQFVPGCWDEHIMPKSAEAVAQEAGICRRDLDAWVLRSHRLACQAEQEGVLRSMQVSVHGSRRDEGIRRHMSEKLLHRLPCILPYGQVLTAANTCLTHDGVAMLVLCSAAYCQRHGCRPLGKIRGACAIGTNPLRSPIGAVQSIEKLLRQYQMTAADIDIFEVNEAFAVIDELFARAYPQCIERYNVLGGALAYGHPYGATGAMLVLHALAALQQTQGTLACCSIAGAGGLGCALLVERV